MARIPDNTEILRTSGFCHACDSWFRNEPAVRFPDPALPGGYCYIEARHLDHPDYAELRRALVEREQESSRTA